MKTTSNFFTNTALLGVAILTLGSVTAPAQVLSSAGVFTQSSINVATGVDPTTLGYSYDGYTFFTPAISGSGSFSDLFSVPSFTSLGAFVNASGSTNTLTSASFSSTFTDAKAYPTFATQTAGGSAGNRYEGGYSNLTVNGTAYHTGVDYKNGSAGTTAVSPTSLGVIQLQSGTPTSFNVGFLLDNSGTNQGQFDQDVFLNLESSTGTVLSTVTLESSQTGSPADNFYYATVSNATAGDYLVLDAYNVYGSTPPTGNTDVAVGGIVFSAAATPEPSTWALFGVSLIGGIAFLAKRRSAAFKA